MRPIQLLLVLFAVLVVALYFRRLRSRLLDRFIFIFIATLAIVMVVQPEWATASAQFLGVGRGADLVTYLGMSSLAFLWLRLYVRQREMEAKLTDLIRQLAIKHAGSPKPKFSRKKKKQR